MPVAVGRTGESRTLVAAVLLGLAWTLVGIGGEARGADPAGEMTALLPRAGEVAGWAPDGPPQAAAGDELFALINGGAELFLQAGFERALTQAYRADGDRRIELEIYRMRAPDSAEAVFRKKTAGGEPAVALGAGGSRGEYYLIFWQDRYLVTATGSDTSQDTMRVVERMARLVEEKIARLLRLSTGRNWTLS